MNRGFKKESVARGELGETEHGWKQEAPWKQKWVKKSEEGLTSQDAAQDGTEGHRTHSSDSTKWVQGDDEN